MRNKDNARLYNFKAPFRGDEERVSRNYFSPYWKKKFKKLLLTRIVWRGLEGLEGLFAEISDSLL